MDMKREVHVGIMDGAVRMELHNNGVGIVAIVNLTPANARILMAKLATWANLLDPPAAASPDGGGA